MLRAVVLSIVALGLAAGPALAEEPPPVARTAVGLVGEWRNTRDTVHLRVAPCGEAYCGTVIWAIPKAREDARRGSGKDLIGRALLRDLRRDEEGNWRGKAFIPDLNADASAKIQQLDKDTMLVSGCLLAGLACKTQHWWRLN